MSEQESLSEMQSQDGEYIVLGQLSLSVSAPNGGDVVTLSFWVFPLKGAKPGIILCQGQERCPFMSLDEEYRLALCPLGQGATVTTTNKLPSQRWTHLACVLEKSSARLIVNGMLQLETEGIPTPSSCGDTPLEFSGAAGVNSTMLFCYNPRLEPRPFCRDEHLSSLPLQLVLVSSSLPCSAPGSDDSVKVEVKDDEVFTVVGGKASCRRKFALDIQLVDALGRPVERDMDIFCSLVYADTEACIRKSHDDAEAPLLTTFDGVEYPSTEKGTRLVGGRASMKLTISQLSSKCDNRLFRVCFQPYVHKVPHPFLKVLSMPIHSVSRKRPHTIRRYRQSGGPELGNIYDAKHKRNTGNRRNDYPVGHSLPALAEHSSGLSPILTSTPHMRSTSPGGGDGTRASLKVTVVKDQLTYKQSHGQVDRGRLSTLSDAEAPNDRKSDDYAKGSDDENVRRVHSNEHTSIAGAEDNEPLQLASGGACERLGSDATATYLGLPMVEVATRLAALQRCMSAQTAEEILTASGPAALSPRKLDQIFTSRTKQVDEYSRLQHILQGHRAEMKRTVEEDEKKINELENMVSEMSQELLRRRGYLNAKRQRYLTEELQVHRILVSTRPSQVESGTPALWGTNVATGFPTIPTSSANTPPSAPDSVANTPTSYPSSLRLSNLDYSRLGGTMSPWLPTNPALLSTHLSHVLSGYPCSPDVSPLGSMTPPKSSDLGSSPLGLPLVGFVPGQCASVMSGAFHRYTVGESCRNPTIFDVSLQECEGQDSKVSRECKLVSNCNGTKAVEGRLQERC